MRSETEKQKEKFEQQTNAVPMLLNPLDNPLFKRKQKKQQQQMTTQTTE